MKKFIENYGIDSYPFVGDTIICILISCQMVKCKYEAGLFDKLLVVRWFRPEDIK